MTIVAGRGLRAGKHAAGKAGVGELPDPTAVGREEGVLADTPGQSDAGSAGVLATHALASSRSVIGKSIIAGSIPCILRPHEPYECALAACERALRLAPNDSNAQVSKGNALFALHRSDEAIAAYQEAVACEAGVKAHFGLGETFSKLQRYDEARAAYEQAIISDPSFMLAYESLKEALRILHRDQEIPQVIERMRLQGYEEVED